jgi:predicted PhzF superfamily epimerase YddE/YHI9
MPDNRCEARVFHGAGAEGNLHRVIYSAERQPPSADDDSRANLVRLSGPLTSLEVEYTNYGNPVRRCGSGTLAVAAFASVYFRASPLRFALHGISGAVEAGFDRQSAYYMDAGLMQRPLPASNPWAHILGQPAMDGVYCGGRSDYVLVEVDSPLRQLRPRLRSLCRFSQRALIVLYRRSDGDAELRYFAPQYGPAEDAATGSAAVQVATYLKQRYGITSVRLHQCSPAGGQLHTECVGQRIRVRGNTSLTY